MIKKINKNLLHKQTKSIRKKKKLENKFFMTKCLKFQPKSFGFSDMRILKAISNQTVEIALRFFTPCEDLNS